MFHRLTSVLASAGLLFGAASSRGDSAPGGNWLYDGGFELRPEPREIGLPSGADRRDFGETAGWSFDTRDPWEGRRSLRLKGARPFVWRLARELPAEQDGVFAVSVRGVSGGLPVEVGFEIFGIDDHYSVGPRATEVRSVSVSENWTRLAVPLRITKETDQGHIRTHLVKAWVRPLAADRGDLWIDGAQLEMGVSEPGPFTSMMPVLPVVRESSMLMRDWFGPAPETVTAPPPPPSLPEGTVALRIDRPVGRAALASGGVPFGPGQAFASTVFRVLDGKGREVPSQTEVLATRPTDGSVISLLVEVAPGAEADITRGLSLAYGGAARPTTSQAENLLARATPEGFELGRGEFTRRFARDSFPGVVVTMADGREFRSDHLRPEQMEIERNGPLHAILRVRGRVADAAGAPLGVVYDCRLHAVRGSRATLVEASYEQQERVSHLPVRSIGFSFSTGEFADAAASAPALMGVGVLGEKGDEAIWSEPARVSAGVTQLRQYFGEGRRDLVLETDGRVVRWEGASASGRMRFPDAVLAVEDFHDLDPIAVEWRPGSVTVQAQPARHATYVELPFGISQTLRFCMGPPTAWDEVVASIPPLRADPAHVALTGVFGGPFLTSAEAALRFPAFEAPLEEFMAAFARGTRRQGTTGAFDFGNAGSPGGWKNNETSLNEALYFQYLRGGDGRLLDRALRMTRQFRDVAVMHAGQNSKWIMTHAAGVPTTQHWHIGHFWSTGLTWHYLLTGDRRSYEAARGAGAELLSRHRQAYTGRERGRMILHLAELYELTHYAALRDALRVHLAHEVPPESGPYYAGLNILALDQADRVLGGDATARARLEEYARHFLEAVSKRDLSSDLDEDRGTHLLSAAAVLAGRYNDPAYLRPIASWMPVQAMGAHSRGPGEVRGAEFLYQAERLGVIWPDNAPRRAAGLSILSGRAGGKRDATFTLRAGPAAGAPAPRLHKLVGFRAGRNAADDVLAYTLLEEGGEAPLLKGEMSGARYETLVLAPASPPQTGQTRKLILETRGDAQVEVDYAGDLALDAGEWKFFRQHRHGAGFAAFELTAAPGGELSLGLDWRHTGHGTIAAFELLDVAGNRLAGARWARPLGVDWDDAGAPLVAPSRLSALVPVEASRGSLRLEVEANKWLGWRIEAGLASPWLYVPRPAGRADAHAGD